MAFVRPPFVVDTTTTTGTGTYTLGDPAAPGDGFRTLADAVANGDASAGDTISYFVLDTTTQAATLTWEHGTGTIGAGGLSLARTTVISSSNGGAAVSWLAGQRTVRFGAGTAGFAFLAAAQTFTALQTFSAGLTSSSTIKVESGATPSPVELRSDNSSGSAGRILFGAHNLSGTDITYGEVRTGITGNVAGAESARFALFLYKAGVNTECFRFNSDGTISDVAGARTFAYQGVLDAPSGGRLLWGVVTIPAGWAIVASLADKVILTTSTASEIDDTGGSWIISGATTTVNSGTAAVTNAGAFAQSEINHVTGSGGAQTGLLLVTDGASKVFGSAYTGVSDSGHTHTASTDFGSSWRPAYYKAGWIAKS